MGLGLSANVLCLTIFTGKILDSYILDGDLLQEIRTLAARITSDNALPSQPITEPSQVTVAVKGIGQKVAVEKKSTAFCCVCFHKFAFACVCECVYSQRRQRVQRVKGSRVHGGNLVVVERQETH